MIEIGAMPNKKLLCLLSNGDVPAWSTQALYEMAWSEGIRPLDEKDLKPDLLTRRKRRKAVVRSLRPKGTYSGSMGGPSLGDTGAAR